MAMYPDMHGQVPVPVPVPVPEPEPEPELEQEQEPEQQPALVPVQALHPQSRAIGAKFAAAVAEENSI
jgi:hypothetical protein